MKLTQNSPRFVLASILAAAALAGCASKTPLNTPAAVETRNALGNAANALAGAGANSGASTVANVNLGTNNADTAVAGRVVYFDYDSFQVKDEFRSVVETNAKAVAAAKGTKVQVEGHTDERGGREYNLALGQKRAEAVVRAMTLLGAPEGSLEAVSYGKERPAATGSDESAYAKNRRAEIKERR